MHFQHGPIDIIAYAEGAPHAVQAAHQSARERFSTILPELVQELPLLKAKVQEFCPLKGAIARGMWHACRDATDLFITPMAAVAGAVAEHLLASYKVDGISRAWVNNGGDIALHLSNGYSFRVGIFSDLAKLNPDDIQIDGVLDITAEMDVGGIATSGWRGRSYSLGIADSVTVLAKTASMADAAATVIANEVVVDSPLIIRRPANDIKDDSDLGEIEVTVDVPPLSEAQIATALENGLKKALELRQNGLIYDSILCCQGWWVSTTSNVLAYREIQ